MLVEYVMWSKQNCGVLMKLCCVMSTELCYIYGIMFYYLNDVILINYIKIMTLTEVHYLNRIVTLTE